MNGASATLARWIPIVARIVREERKTVCFAIEVTLTAHAAVTTLSFYIIKLLDVAIGGPPALGCNFQSLVHNEKIVECIADPCKESASVQGLPHGIIHHHQEVCQIGVSSQTYL